MASDPDVVSDGPDNLNVGVGSVLRYDSRDVPQNAYRGVFLQAAFVPYLSYHGNHVGYRIFDLDYRQYQTIAREGSTLAWTFRARYGAGEVPWSELGELGSPFDLRGYRWGRYRDDAIAYTIVEYRFTFAKGRHADGRVKLSRHGVVGWIGAGVLGEDYLHLGGLLPNAGVGYRFAVQGRLNARVDLGFGADAQAFYVNFTEAY